MAGDPPVVDRDLRDELVRRRDADQHARWACALLFADIPDGTPWLSELLAGEQELFTRLAAVDRENTRWLGDLVARRGWPTRSLVGEEAASGAWLLAQHADKNTALQRQCLELMLAAPETEVRPAHIAYLTDRVLLAEGKSQVYGTQMTMVDTEYRPINLRDHNSVDERRAQVGLGTMAAYQESLRHGTIKLAQTV
jgi:hypothetical protein